MKEIKNISVSTAESKSSFIKYFQSAITFISGHDHNFEVMMKLVRKKHSSSDCGKAVRPSEWWEGQSIEARLECENGLDPGPSTNMTLTYVDMFQLYL